MINQAIFQCQFLSSIIHLSFDYKRSIAYMDTFYHKHRTDSKKEPVWQAAKKRVRKYLKISSSLFIFVDSFLNQDETSEDG